MYSVLEGSTRGQKTVFLGGIPLNTTQQDIIEFLSPFDQVLRVDIARDKYTKELKGYAKAVLKTEEGIQRLLHNRFHTIHGLPIGVKRWTNKQDYLKEKDEISRRKLFVRHHSSYTPDSLFHHFSQFGQVVSIDTKTEHFTNKYRNFSYVIFKSEEEAYEAAFYGSVSDKSSYIHCEMTTPSHLMVENKTSISGSPGMKRPTKSTRLGTNLTFEPKDSFQMLLDQPVASSFKEINSAPIAKKKGKINPKEHYANFAREVEKKNPKLAGIKSMGNLAGQNKEKIISQTYSSLAKEFFQLHDTKPTSRRYHQVLHSKLLQSGDNLVFRKVKYAVGHVGDRR